MSAATEVVGRLFAALNKHDMTVINELIPDCAYHGSAIGELKGEGLKQFINNSVFTAFPDAHWAVEDQLAEGDKVVTRWTFTGTHKAQFKDIAATNKRLALSVLTMFRVAGGKIVEMWEEWDALSMMRQMGVMPEIKVAEPVAA